MDSASLFKEALTLMAGGVSSPVRAFAPYPSYITKGKGPRIWDVEGREYVDLCLGFGPLIVGHAHPSVVQALSKRIESGTLFGAPVEEEILLAKKVMERVPSVRRLRFTTSGAEATSVAVRLARAVTGRSRILVFRGCYHGAHDSLLSSKSQKEAALTRSAGIPREFHSLLIAAEFNDLSGAVETIRRNRRVLAGIILEPILGNFGVIPPDLDFLKGLREETERLGIPLIFDEVITGFRVHSGGAQELYGVRPDITTFGKVLGGGLPLSAVGGREDIIDRLAPKGDVFHAGTYNGNPLSLSAGVATLELLRPEVYERLSATSLALTKKLHQVLEELKLDYDVQAVGSMFQIFFTSAPVRTRKQALRSDVKRFLRFFRAMLDEGVYLPPAQFESNFLSTEHDEKEMQKVLGAYRKCLSLVSKSG